MPAGIYLHVPFCKRKCHYCDFYSIARPDMAEAYVAAVEREYAARRHELGDNAVVTLYFGGGTPSLLPPPLFSRLARLLRTPDVEEFTVEANPDNVTPQMAAMWRNEGANRVSIGIQSLCDNELRAIGRLHDSSLALKAISVLADAGFDNISADLIYGLPLQTPDTFRYSLRHLLAEPVTHLSAYCLSYEEGTALWRRRQNGDIAETDDDTITEMYSILCDITSRHGFEHYEISNFALPGCRSRHNSSYWRRTPYLGLGPGAHSLAADGRRRHNGPDLRRYIAAPATVLADDPETDTDRINDTIMTSLRTSGGLDLGAVPPAQRRTILAAAGPWLRSGRLTMNNNTLTIPEDAWLVSDAIIRDLFI